MIDRMAATDPEPLIRRYERHDLRSHNAGAVRQSRVTRPRPQRGHRYVDDVRLGVQIRHLGYGDPLGEVCRTVHFGSPEVNARDPRMEDNSH